MLSVRLFVKRGVRRLERNEIPLYIKLLLVVALLLLLIVVVVVVALLVVVFIAVNTQSTPKVISGITPIIKFQVN